MNTISKIIKVSALAAACALLFASCNKEPQEKVAKAVLGDQSIMTFAAKNPAAQTVTVYSDGPWHTTAPDWISVDPNTGDGVVTVTVTAQENVDAGGMLEPRKDTLIISGKTLASRLLIFVSQEGDAYRNAQHLTLDKVAALADGKSFILDEATVAAVTSAGYVVNSGSTNVYVKDSNSPKIGDKVSIKGIKGSSNNLPAITTVDDFKVLSSGTFTYPEPRNITDEIATFKGDAMDYITVNGMVKGGNLIVTANDIEYSVKQLDCPADLSISKLNGNKVQLTGYCGGLLGANLFGILTTVLKDNGPAVVPRPDKLLYAKWRFTATTMTAYQDFFGGTGGKLDTAPGNGGLYVPSNVEGNGKIEYYQVDKSEIDINNKASRIIGSTGHPYVTGAWPGDYWLFSATDNYEYPAGTNLHIKFMTRVSATGQRYWMLEYFDGNDWQPAEEYPVSTETESGTNARYNFQEPTSNIVVECAWKLAAPCREPMFRMRCVANAQANDKGPLANPNGGTCRISDNGDEGEDAGPVFEVTDAPAGGGGGGGGTAGVTVFEDDFEWVEPWATAANAGDAVATNNPSATAPNVFTTTTCEGFLNEFSSRGYGYYEGKQGMEWTDVTAENIPAKVLYLQKNYLKFGKSDWNSGITLPALSSLSSKANVALDFDWCWQVTGGFKPDLMTITVEIVGNGVCADNNDSLSPHIQSAQSQVDGESKIEWQHASITLNGVDSGTRIKIRPTNYDPYVENPARGQNRWYLDNIKVVTK
ncbi:MAG: BACON domain-containing protein [Bacteroidales bacterium]|nr:BACON domain-containing protein [Bacteroidales bacterium]